MTPEKLQEFNEAIHQLHESGPIMERNGQEFDRLVALLALAESENVRSTCVLLPTLDLSEQPEAPAISRMVEMFWPLVKENRQFGTGKPLIELWRDVCQGAWIGWVYPVGPYTSRVDHYLDIENHLARWQSLPADLDKFLSCLQAQLQPKHGHKPVFVLPIIGTAPRLETAMKKLNHPALVFLVRK